MVQSTYFLFFLCYFFNLKFSWGRLEKETQIPEDSCTRGFGHSECIARTKGEPESQGYDAREQWGLAVKLSGLGWFSPKEKFYFVPLPSSACFALEGHIASYCSAWWTNPGLCRDPCPSPYPSRHCPAPTNTRHGHMRSSADGARGLAARHWQRQSQLVRWG